MKHRNLVLIGLRATGKSTLANALAAELDWTCVDTDQQIEQLCQAPVADVFSQQGEAYFRERETEVLMQLRVVQQHVISTGGGAVLRTENRALLGQLGCCIWLDAEVAVLQQRMQQAPGTRPALHGDDPLTEMTQVRTEREALYAELADLRLDTGQATIPELLQQVLAHLQEPEA